ncbi:MAG: hypothetical protein SGARI_008197, partial [Bacillariaceae sp.]
MPSSSSRRAPRKSRSFRKSTEDECHEIQHPLASFLSQTSPVGKARKKKSSNVSVMSVMTQDSMSSIDFTDIQKELPVMGECSTSTEMTSSTNRGFGTLVQSDLRWGCDPKLAQRYCNEELIEDEEEIEFNFEIQSSFEDDAVEEVRQKGRVKFYDSNSGKTLFMVRKESPYRTFEDFLEESIDQGFLCFRDYEVNWQRVLSRNNGELFSKDGTKLGFHSPDTEGNKYLVNLLAVAGKPLREKRQKAHRRGSVGSM